jgi:hypothetical protein
MFAIKTMERKEKLPATQTREKQQRIAEHKRADGLSSTGAIY